jgi:hypothetical protein
VSAGLGESAALFDAEEPDPGLWARAEVVSSRADTVAVEPEEQGELCGWACDANAGAAAKAVIRNDPPATARIVRAARASSSGTPALRRSSRPGPGSAS